MKAILDNQLICGILVTLISSAIIAVVTYLVRYYVLYHGSVYAGHWEDEIFEDDTMTKVVKRDECILKHNKHTNVITGTVRRMEPYDQRHREWYCQGVIDNEYLILTVWAKDNLIKSNSSMYAKLVRDYVFEGYYLEDRDGKIEKFPIRMKCDRRDNIVAE